MLAVSMMYQHLPEDMSMFYDGVYDLVHRYSEKGSRFITLEDTLAGYMLNQLTWCGMKEHPGYNEGWCPKCRDSATDGFWGAASKQFAIPYCVKNAVNSH
ncbi:ADP-ribosyl cyclase/cyclic ADP-ribose hydrolase-like [Aplysia californica]|uniref:ADP-ribosyl cyclase/cyclic ADP-ribose hydrolase-like n=1 Tax=Aplysia californica TaxID=6500 RepID=A0ABM1VXP3_APLCA|nr:ADP-ribosyl cyclase/cyclic ADP-ribose hydrolase-like [Aplysia californica]